VPLGQFPNACGIFGAGTCVPRPEATACGGEGQRACCPGEGAACQPGLVKSEDDGVADFFIPVGGDATCGGKPITGSAVDRTTSTCVAANPGPIDEPTTGWNPTPEPRGLLRGYHDMHLHLLGHMAHGGQNLSGQPAPIGGNGRFTLDATHNINTALSVGIDLANHQQHHHGIVTDTSGDGTGDGTRSAFGAPYFNGWPKWHSTTHQQTYYPWLERAWRGGLRSTTLFASHVESLCKQSLGADPAQPWFAACENSMGYVVQQLKAAQDFEDFIDAQSGGDGLGWFRIVRTPQEARAAVRAGKLAVTLGIEVDNLFNCKEAGCPPDFGLPIGLTGLPTPNTLNEAVDVIYALGVRHVFPIHNFDNAFGGAATWMDPISVGQAVSEGRWWETRDCGTGKGNYGFWLDNVFQTILRNVGFTFVPLPNIPSYTNGNLEPDYASCNVRGLQPLGGVLLRLLMNKGILIDIDHMGANSLDETIAITSRGPDDNGLAYPLVASHVLAFDLHPMAFTGSKGRHERMRTRAQLDAIRAGGGMVAAMLKDDVQDTSLKGSKFTLSRQPLFGSAIPDNCRHSSKSWAQLFIYSVDIMEGPVAMGSDWNGAAGHLGPRFGSDACGGWGESNGIERPLQLIEGAMLEYPFTLAGFGTFDRQVTGFRTFDYNFDGLAHIGLVPDMIADLQRLGIHQHYLDQLFCSSEAYIRVWERADALAGRRAPPDPNRTWLCNVTDSTPPTSMATLSPAPNANGWHRADVTASIVATDAGSGVERIEYSVTPGASGQAVGDAATVVIGGEGDVQLSYFATDGAGNSETPNTVSARIDRSPPAIEASRTPANAAGWNNGDVTVTFACTDGVSGVDTCAAPQTLAGEGAGQSASGQATDVAGNSASASVGDINIDRTAPVVVVTGVTNGAVYNAGAVPQAGCSTSDALSGVATPAAVSVTGGTSNGVGTYAVSCSGAMDAAGNSGAASAVYAVRYVFNGFFSPIGNAPVVNAIKAGQTVPVKFSLGGNHGLDVLLGGAATSAVVSCTAADSGDLVEVPVSYPGASQFGYDAGTNLYQFNWKTEKAWANSCRRLLVRLDDGTVHTAEFRLR
jgi:microsomal dipeptidase-like Zn-dependent dipeptidase